MQVPIASSFLLSSKAGKEAWIEPIVDKAAKTISYRIRKGGTKEEIAKAKAGTKAGRAVFRCVFSDAPISGDYVDKEAAKGNMSQVLIAIVAEGVRKRIYVSADSREQLAAIKSSVAASERMDMSHLQVPCRGTFASNAQGRRYGFNVFKDYFTDRQLVALNTFSDLVHEARTEIERDALAAGLSDDPTPLRDGGIGAKAYAEAVSVYLAFWSDKLLITAQQFAGWITPNQAMRSTFARQAIQMTLGLC